MVSYSNPVLPGAFPDPAVCRVGGDIYLACSSFEYWPGYPVLHSRDLVHWRIIGHAFGADSGIALDQAPHGMGLWGGGLRHIRGRFWCVTTTSEDGQSLLSSAVDPAGPWTPPVRLGRLGMDPDLFEDVDGSTYYCLRAYGPGRSQPVGARLARIDLDAGKLLEDLQLILPETNQFGIEGPRILHHDGWYYLHCAAGGTEHGHCQPVWRSRTLRGPYERGPHDLIPNQASFWGVPQCIGHGELIDDAQGRWWVLFHGNRIGPSHGTLAGRELYLAPVTWRDGWPQAAAGDLIRWQMAADLPSVQPWPRTDRDLFSDSPLPPHYQTLRQPPAEAWSLSSNGLVLRGTATALHDPLPAPAWVGRRLDVVEGYFRAQVEVELGAANDEAGLVAWLNERHFAALTLVRRDGRRLAVLRRRVGDLQDEVGAVAVADGPVVLRFDFDPATIRAGIEVDGVVLPVGIHDRHLISFEVGGKFSGPYVAMYASGNGRPASAAATFRWCDRHGT